MAATDSPISQGTSLTSPVVSRENAALLAVMRVMQDHLATGRSQWRQADNASADIESQAIRLEPRGSIPEPRSWSLNLPANFIQKLASQFTEIERDAAKTGYFLTPESEYRYAIIVDSDGEIARHLSAVVHDRNGEALVIDIEAPLIGNRVASVEPVPLGDQIRAACYLVGLLSQANGTLCLIESSRRHLIRNLKLLGLFLDSSGIATGVVQSEPTDHEGQPS